MSIEFLITSLIVVIAPGTGVLYTLANGLTRGGRASIAAAFGCTLGIIPHMTAAILGLAALLHTSAVLFQLFKYAGLAYLLYLAWRTLNDCSPLSVDPSQSRRDAGGIILKGVLINVLNPKLSIFFMAFLPQFISSGSATPMLDMTFLSGIFMAMTFAVFVLYGVFAAYVRHHVISRPNILAWVRRAFAAAFAGLGVKLALSES